ncbi:MAG TPA: hypothetical protein ENI51_10305 [Candidatus Atribacteria bacterium]|nr:hypothetical protein [Candidatus Atribacteria bacterium]
MINKFRKALVLIGKKQFLPTLKDLENEELKNLADRLKGGSDKETLTNILEWEDRNIQFWWERWPFDLSLKFLGPISWMLVLIIFFPFLQLLYPSKFLIIEALLTVFVTIFIFISMLSNVLPLVFYVFLFLPIVYLLTSVALRIPLLAQNILPYTLFYVGCLGAVILIMVYLFIRYSIFFREEKSISKKLFKFLELVNRTFQLSLPLNKLLDHKLAVCRDYAKLTASLLFNVYPDSEVYFITIPGHVAAGTKIKNKIYVLDQRLPILTTDNWLIKWNKKKASTYISKLKRDSGGRPIDVTFDKHDPLTREQKEVPKINNTELTEEITNLLGINQNLHKYKTGFRIRLKNFVIPYEDDAITKYSLIRAIKNKLESELCSNMDKISKIEINQDKSDLIVRVYL